ncbi:MAG: oligoendopeptidase F [Lachnospiraceae bacterium]|nr:oligoendopeptidase F [Lachnospiraceae bacterium]
MSQNTRLPEREEIAVKDTWALEDLCASDDAWKKEYEELQEKIPALAGYAGTLGNGADTLYQCLELQSDASWHMERLYVYAKEKYDQNTGNAVYQDLCGKAQTLLVSLSSAGSYIVPEIMSLSKEYLEQCFEEKKELSLYRLTIERLLRKKEHVLSAEIEAVLAKSQEIAQSPSDIFSKFNNADIVFPDAVGSDGEARQLTNGSYVPFLMSQDRTLRKDAFEKLYQVYKEHINTLAAVFAANVKQEAFYADMRKYPSSMAMELAGGNIPTSVYTNLIDTVHKNLGLMHRYIALRKKMLGVDELHMYDVYVPIVSDVAKEVTFEEAKEMLLEGLAPLGEDYLSHLKEGFENRWIDVYENKGKRTGAYSWGAYGTHPYVLLNHHNDLEHAFTLAHEMGHALHTYYSNKCQPYEYAGYLIFVAEVASTCNEALLMTHLLEKTTDPKERAYLVNSFLEKFRGTLYRQTMFAEFEMLAHEMAAKGTTLTAEVLCRTYHDLNRQYFGEDMISDDEIAYEWARIPHFYTPFYVYQYATGFSAAIALSRKILKEGEPAVRDYIDKFLSAGSSADPIDILKAAGVDMSSPKPIEEALGLFEELIEELEALTK